MNRTTQRTTEAQTSAEAAAISALHVFDNGSEWVVASNVEDAWDVWCAHVGESRQDYEGEWAWFQEPDDRPLHVWCDPDGDITTPNEDGASAAAPWNVLDDSGTRIAICGYDDAHETTGPAIAAELVARSAELAAALGWTLDASWSAMLQAVRDGLRENRRLLAAIGERR